MTYISLENVTNNILNKINLEIKKSEFLTIIGSNKSGKTSLLYAICGIDDIKDGKIIIDNKIINNLSEKKLTKLRRDMIGFVFEEPIFLENLTTLENVQLANQISKNGIEALECIKKVGLLNKEHHYPYELSSSEKTLLSIAMAIAKKPSILLCDEPLNALDSKSKKKIIKLFETLSKKEKMTIIITNKDDEISPTLKNVINIKDGNLVQKKNIKKKAIR